MGYNVITSATLKGGTGKTATLFNLAGLLAESRRVLLIDCDPQTNLSLNCGVGVMKDSIATIKGVFEGTSAVDQVIHKAPIPELPGLDIIPSHIALTATELQMVARPGRENILHSFLEDNKRELSVYDYIMIDTSPLETIPTPTCILSLLEYLQIFAPKPHPTAFVTIATKVKAKINNKA